ncbi:MAG TPA: FHA domain-containing protein [Gemmataceae bacterium]|nr:FHA domain-containing protein [Gemmataceae bacterium]
MNRKVNGELTPQGGGDPIPLIREVMTVGRRETCDIPLRFPDISGMHCQLYFRNGYWYVKDLNSTNGVKVNGTRVQEKVLHPRDELSIGRRRKYLIEYDMPTGQSALEEELEEDLMGQSLLEKAGLEKPQPRKKGRKPGASVDAADFLLSDDD